MVKWLETTTADCWSRRWGSGIRGIPKESTLQVGLDWTAQKPWQSLTASHSTHIIDILLMEEILHHLGWLNNGIIIIPGGAGFCPSTVWLHISSYCLRLAGMFSEDIALWGSRVYEFLHHSSEVFLVEAKTCQGDTSQPQHWTYKAKEDYIHANQN